MNRVKISCTAQDIFGNGIKLLPCRICNDTTPHVEVDTVWGKRFQCEICGTDFEATDEEIYAKAKERRLRK